MLEKTTTVVVCDMFLRYMTPGQSRIYYYLRATDVDGNGCVVLPQQELLDFLNLDLEKANKHLGKWIGFLFRAFYWNSKDKTITFYLRKQYDIAKSLGIKSFKSCAFAEVELQDVLDSPKTLGIEIGVKYQQHKTHYQLKHDKENNQRVLPLVFNSTSNLAQGVEQYDFKNNTPNAIVLTDDSVVSYGTSQSKLANILGVSVSTVKRHLTHVTKHKCYQQVSKALVFCEQQLKTDNYYFFFKWLNNYVKPLPNIYVNDIVFKTKRMFKTKYNKYILSVQGS